MDFDVEHQVLQTATELYELAMGETDTLARYEKKLPCNSPAMYWSGIPTSQLICSPSLWGEHWEDSKDDGAFQQ